MKCSYNKNIEATHFVIEIPETFQKDYQLQMLEANHIEGLLDVCARGEGSGSRFAYDISGKVSLLAWNENSILKAKQMRDFIEQFLQLIKKVRSFLLDPDCILLQPECVFYTKGQFYFCYCPLYHQPLYESFHLLTEYFVSKADYQDKTSIHLAYELHKGSMEEHYSIRQLLLRAEETQEENPEQEEKEQEQKEWPVCADENIQSVSKRHSAFREENGILRSIKRKVAMKKSRKWGDWEALYFEDE